MRASRFLPMALLMACASADTTKSDPSSADPGTTTADPNPGDHAGPTDDPTDAPGPSAYDPDLPEVSTATFHQAAVENALALVVDSLATLSSDPVFDAYDSAMGRGEGYCPAYYEQNGNVFWYASCTTSSGTWFDGYAFYNYYDDYTVDGEGNLWDTEYISGAGTVREATGETFHIGGYVQRAWTVGSNGFLIVQDSLQGSFLDDYAPADSWLGKGHQPALVHYMSVSETGGFAVGGYRGWGGSLGGLGDAGQVAMDADTLIIATTSLGVPCQDEPAGSLSVRTEDGGWWTITFDMNPDVWALEGACDGCGTVTDASGAVVGEACADFSSLLDL